MKHVLVLNAQVPFTRGGAELLCESLVAQINKLDGICAELVHLPYKWYPEKQILNDITAWRLLDLSESNGMKVDLIIATKFPTYAAQHKNKVLWLVHQHRIFYDLENSEYDGMIHQPNSKIIRQKVRELDNKFFKECNQLYTIADNVSSRLKKFNGFESTPLFPPPILGDRIYAQNYNKKIIYIGRLDPIKRPDLLVRALRHTTSGTIAIIGKGRPEDYQRIQTIIDHEHLSDRCEVLGYLAEDKLLAELANCRAVFYAPVDEDYGYTTIEAFLAKKPVITCHDSGQITTFVKQTGSGFVSETNPKAIASNMQKVYDMSEKELTTLTEKGYQVAKEITWEKVLKNLVLDRL